MGVLKFLGKFFGSFLIVLAITILFIGLSIQYSIENLDVISKSAQESFPKILQENRGLILNALSEEGKINKAVIKDSCVKNPDALPKDFCNRLGGLTEEQAVEELTDIMISKLQDEYKSEFIEGFEQNIESQLKEEMFLNYLKYAAPLGILIFLLGSLLIFFAESFKIMITLFHISWKTGIVSGFVAVTNYLVKKVTPESVEEFISPLPMMKGEQGSILVVKLISASLTDWIRIVSTKIFYISMIVTAASFIIVIILFILKRKLAKKEEPEKKEGELEKIVEGKLKEKIKSKKVSKKKK